MRAKLVALLLLGLNGCIHISPDLQRQQCVDTRPPTPPTCDDQERTRVAEEAVAWFNLSLALFNLSTALGRIH